jgi:hypothetical protein
MVTKMSEMGPLLLDRNLNFSSAERLYAVCRMF